MVVAAITFMDSHKCMYAGNGTTYGKDNVWRKDFAA